MNGDEIWKTYGKDEEIYGKRMCRGKAYMEIAQEDNIGK